MYTTESKKRRPRFSNAEIVVLVNEVYRNKEVLFSKKCSTYSNEQKSRAWQAVTDSINEVCMVEPRTPDEVRRKWYYYLSDKKKETARQKHQKKTSHTAPSILYSSTDLKILEILGEIDAGEADDDDDDDEVEGLICEVDADALPMRSPSLTHSCEDMNNAEHQKFLSPEVSLEEIHEGHVEYQGKAINGFINSLNEESVASESNGLPLYDYHQLQTKVPSQRRRQRSSGAGDGDVKDDTHCMELLLLEKRRVILQECQLQVLQDIRKQMQEDSERDRAFQNAFLDIQRQRLELKKEANRRKT